MRFFQSAFQRFTHQLNLSLWKHATMFNPFFYFFQNYWERVNKRIKAVVLRFLFNHQEPAFFFFPLYLFFFHLIMMKRQHTFSLWLFRFSVSFVCYFEGFFFFWKFKKRKNIEFPNRFATPVWWGVCYGKSFDT